MGWFIYNWIVISQLDVNFNEIDTIYITRYNIVNGRYYCYINILQTESNEDIRLAPFRSLLRIALILCFMASMSRCSSFAFFFTFRVISFAVSLNSSFGETRHLKMIVHIHNGKNNCNKAGTEAGITFCSFKNICSELPSLLCLLRGLNPARYPERLMENEP